MPRKRTAKHECPNDVSNTEFTDTWWSSPVSKPISNAVPVSNDRYKEGVPRITQLGCIGNRRNIYVSVRCTVLYQNKPFQYNLYDGMFFVLRMKDSADGTITKEIPILNEEPIHWPPNTWLEVAYQFPKPYSYRSGPGDRNSDLLRPNRFTKSRSRATILRKRAPREEGPKKKK